MFSATTIALISLATTAASTAYQFRQASKKRKEAERAADARKGFELVVDSTSIPLPIVYGRAKVGGVRTWHHTSNNFTYAANSANKSFSLGAPAYGGGTWSEWVLISSVEDGIYQEIIHTYPSNSGGFLNKDMSGDTNSFLFFQQALCQGPIQGVWDLVINDSMTLDEPTLATQYNASTPWNTDVKAALRIDCFYGDTPVADTLIAVNDGSRGASKFSGAAYLSATIRLNRDDPQFNAVPNVQALIEGRKVYTYSSGIKSGSRTYTSNPAWCLLDYLMDTNCGRGLLEAELDIASFEYAASVCASTVLSNAQVGGKIWKTTDYPGASGGRSITSRNIPLYECNIVIDTSKPIRENVEAILGTMGDARLVWSQGKYKLLLEYPSTNEWLDSNGKVALTLTDDDLIDSDTIDIAWPSSSERLNYCTVRFHNEAKDFEEDSASWPAKVGGVVLKGIGGTLYPPVSGWDDSRAGGKLLNTYGVWSGQTQSTTLSWKFYIKEGGSHTFYYTADNSATITLNRSTSGNVSVTSPNNWQNEYSVTFFANTNEIITLTAVVTDTGGIKGFAGKVLNSSNKMLIWSSRSIAYTGFNAIDFTSQASLYSQYFTLEDSEVPLESDIFVDGICDYYHALAKAEELVRTSRTAFTVKFKYLVKSKFLEPGDFIKLNSTTVGLGTVYLRVNDVRIVEGLIAEVTATRFDFTQLAWNVPDGQYAIPKVPTELVVNAPNTVWFVAGANDIYLSLGSVKWDPVAHPNLVGYIIYSHKANDNNADGTPRFSEIGRADASVNSFPLPPISFASGSFGVRAYTSAAQSSMTISASIQLSSGLKPPSPTSPTLTKTGVPDKYIEVAWQRPALRDDGTPYNDHLSTLVYRSTTNNYNDAVLVYEVSGNSILDPVLSTDRYYYWLANRSFRGVLSNATFVGYIDVTYIITGEVDIGGGASAPIQDIIATKVATVYLYQWSLALPSSPSGSSNFNWTTNAHTTYVPLVGDQWSLTIPANPGGAGIKLWVAAKTIEEVISVNTSVVNWNDVGSYTISVLSENGSDGPPGTKSYNVLIYKWDIGEIAPTVTGSTTFTWDTKDLSFIPSGWSTNPGSGNVGESLWAASYVLLEADDVPTTTFNWTSAKVYRTAYLGVDGDDAPLVQVIGEQAFKYAAGATTPINTTITLRAVLSGNLATYQWKYWNPDTSQWVNFSSATNSTYALSYTSMTGNMSQLIRVACFSDTYYDEISVVKVIDGSDAYTGYLTNESHTIPANNDGTYIVGNLTAAGGTFKVYKGANVLSSGVTFSVTTGTANGLTLAINSSTGVYTLSGASWNTDVQTFEVVATVTGGPTLSKIYTIAKAKVGAQGSVGNSIKVSGENSFKFLANSSTPIKTANSLSATLTGTLTTYDWEYFNNSVWVDLPSNTGSVYTINYNDAVWTTMGNPTSLYIRCGSGGLYDYITVVKLYDGNDGLVGYLTNEAHIAPANSDGTSTDLTGSGGTYNVYQGTILKNSSTTYTVVGGAVNGSNHELTTNGLKMSINQTTGVYTLSGTWAAARSIETFTLRAAYSGNNLDKVYSITKSKAGLVGSAAAYVIMSGAQVFKYTSNPSVPDNTTINLALSIYNFTATTYDWEYYNAGSWTDLTAPQNTATYSLSYTQVSGDTIRVRCVVNGTYSDELTIIKVKDGTAIVGYLTNEAHTIPTDSAGAFSAGDLTGSGGTFKVYQGTTDVTTSATYTISSPTSSDATTVWKTLNGLTLTINKTSGAYTLSGTGWSTSVETFDLQSTYSGVTLTKSYSISKAKAGVTPTVPIIYYLEPNTYVIYKDAIDAATSGTHTAIIINGKKNTSGTITDHGYATITGNGGTEAGTATLTPFTYTPTTTEGKTSYTIKLYDTSGKTTLRDTMEIPVIFKGATGSTGTAGVSGVTTVLSNEAHVVPANADGSLLGGALTGSGTTIYAYEGFTNLTATTSTPGNGQFRVTIGTATGITPGALNTATSPSRFVLSDATGMSADYATVPLTIETKSSTGVSTTITKTQTLAKAKIGGAGSGGLSARVCYILSTVTSPVGSTPINKTGDVTLGSGDFGFTGTWTSSPGTPSINERVWQSNGFYNPSTNQTTWYVPIIATFSVGQLSAISTNTGNLVVNNTIDVNSTGSIASYTGATRKSYGDSNAGYYLGYSGAAHKFDIGDSTTNLRWDGSALAIKGNIRGGSATAYGSGTGYYLDNAGNARFGNPTGARLQWTGSAVEIYNSSNQLTFASGGLDWSQIIGTPPSTISNSSIAISGGAITGIGTGSGTQVENSLLVPSINSAASTANWANLSGTIPAQVDNNYLGLTNNLYPDSDMTTTNRWYTTYSPNGAAIGYIDLSSNQLGSIYILNAGKLKNAVTYQSNRATGTSDTSPDGYGNLMAYDVACGAWPNGLVPVIPGQRIVYSIYVTSHRCRAQIFIAHYTKDGSNPSWDWGNTSGIANNTADSLGTYERLYGVMIVPANIYAVQIRLRKYNTISGETNSYLWMAGPQVEVVGPSVSTPSPYMSGPPSDLTGLVSSGKITTGNASTYIANGAFGTAQIADLHASKLTAYSIDTLQIKVGAVTASQKAVSTGYIWTVGSSGAQVESVNWGASAFHLFNLTVGNGTPIKFSGTVDLTILFNNLNPWYANIRLRLFMGNAEYDIHYTTQKVFRDGSSTSKLQTIIPWSVGHSFVYGGTYGFAIYAEIWFKTESGDAAYTWGVMDASIAAYAEENKV